jgi:TetR/AcrR family transcriptional repressor of nem operon
MLDRGFAATSVDEVIAAAKSSKGAFFNHFPSKGALGRALITRYAEADVAHLHEFMGRAEALSDDPAEQVIAFIRLFEEAADEIVVANQSSCLYVSFLQERELTTDGNRDVIVTAVEAWRDVLSAKLHDAAGTRELPGELDIADLADHVFVTFEGTFILARTMGDPNHMRAQLRILRLLITTLLREGSEPAA